MLAGLREREELHAALGRYADPEVARRVLDDPDALAGEEVEVTVMFVDIRGFTTAIDGIAPRDAVARLNSFFEVVVPVLQGTAATRTSSSATACSASSACPSTTPTTPTARWPPHATSTAASRRPSPGRCGSASASTPGRVLAGTVGGGGKLEFALIGDAVNVAARVEELTKETGDGCSARRRRALALQRDGAGLRPRASGCCAAGPSRRRSTPSADAGAAEPPSPATSSSCRASSPSGHR